MSPDLAVVADLSRVTGAAEDRPAVVPIDALLASDSPRLNGENAEHVQTLAKLRDALPPILVHHETMRVIDGMHRLRAARLRGDETIAVEYFKGSEDDVFALSVRLNIAHGLPLSREDRMAAAERLLKVYPYWSNRRIAVNAGLSATSIASLRRRSTGQGEQLTARVGRDGRVRPLHASEGRLRASRVIADNPHASLREIAERAGIAAATAKDVRDRMRRGEDPVPAQRKAAREKVTAAAPGPDEGSAERTSPAAIGPTLSNMRKDPSLRTDAGRTLLQLLSAHSIGDDAQWDLWMRGVPEHRKDMLAQAARRCADRWLRFANELETRRM
ncbi:ParB/RepB/Spo0J family partition protein (plasmid) [Streptomyces sp. NBC_01136]|uniref:ParB/RepB/Spo0J family partition protein n=1 Tax=unclassified Streptomyces TaxID=2593676 RepID=UPI002F911C9B|nr:ParB/RepB/Spo0J family partition protein [Streptomyces sp. NBC_01136]